jgi:glycosyltransferase involved in cell wall biosynthesis
MIAAGHEVTAMASDDDAYVIERMTSMGVKYCSYPVHRNGLNPLSDLHTFFSLRKLFREINPDVVLAYTIKPVIWGGIALMGRSTTRFYALITGLGYSFNDSDSFARKALSVLVTQLYRTALFKTSRVIFQNPDDRDLFIARQIVGKDKCALVNGSGVDLNRFPLTSLPIDGVVFLMIGRLLGEKGFREYAKAASLVKARYPDAVFRMLGPEDPSPDGIPLEEIRNWQAKGWVEYLGETPDVRPFINDCHIFVLPSYHEGMPRTVLEAMAMGRPILTTDAPGCRETVTPGENGYLVPKGDADALAERMFWFIEHRVEWNRMGLRSREIAEERFNVHDINRELLKIMELLPEPAG